MVAIDSAKIGMFRAVYAAERMRKLFHNFFYCLLFQSPK